MSKRHCGEEGSASSALRVDAQSRGAARVVSPRGPHHAFTTEVPTSTTATGPTIFSVKSHSHLPGQGIVGGSISGIGGGGGGGMSRARAAAFIARVAPLLLALTGFILWHGAKSELRSVSETMSAKVTDVEAMLRESREDTRLVKARGESELAALRRKDASALAAVTARCREDEDHLRSELSAAERVKNDAEKQSAASAAEAAEATAKAREASAVAATVTVTSAASSTDGRRGALPLDGGAGAGGAGDGGGGGGGYGQTVRGGGGGDVNVNEKILTARDALLSLGQALYSNAPASFLPREGSPDALAAAAARDRAALAACPEFQQRAGLHGDSSSSGVDSSSSGVVHDENDVSSLVFRDYVFHNPGRPGEDDRGGGGYGQTVRGGGGGRGSGYGAAGPGVGIDYSHMAMLSRLPRAALWRWILVWQAAAVKEGEPDQHFLCAFSDDALTWTSPVAMPLGKQRGAIPWSPVLHLDGDNLAGAWRESTRIE